MISEKPKLNLVTCPNAIVSEGPEELTLRSAENGTQKAFQQDDLQKVSRWSPPLVDAGWYALVKGFCEGVEAADRNERLKPSEENSFRTKTW